MSEFKRFKSPDKNTTIRVCNTIGHTAVIDSEYTPVHKSLWGLAYAEGAIPEDIKTSDQKDFVKEQRALKLAEQEKAHNQLKEKLQFVYDNPNNFLTPKNNNLIIRKVLDYLKEPIPTNLIDKAWNEVVLENTNKK